MKQVMATNTVNGMIIGLYPDMQTIYQSEGTENIVWTQAGSNYEKLNYVAVSGDGQQIYVVSTRGYLFQKKKNNYVKVGGPNQPITTVAINSDGSTLAVTTEDGSLYYCNGPPCESSNSWIKDTGGNEKYSQVAMADDTKTVIVIEGSTDDTLFKTNTDPKDPDLVPSSSWKPLPTGGTTDDDKDDDLVEDDDNSQDDDDDDDDDDVDDD